MKPVVSALNAWSWYVVSARSQSFMILNANDGLRYSVVVSVAAIIILSIIGGLFKVRGPHT